ncbi:hypothetical protein [Mycolicibacterium fluoranthenivorans]|uniref:Uncharacterized protein n=1 Tax=Mycolicibacterium fluoranthenivorans TaxID=258505 RepID=A0A1G4X2R3_9MYCO|nr:hypothetical protein [Mycolicibacterium fluoranthenivorans]SCX34550.1 hypothetical protein SAMN02799620_06377 [Mycolicibacterium fluoranthenivorans]
MTDEELAIIARAAIILSKHGRMDIVEELATIAQNEMAARELCQCTSLIEVDGRLQCLQHGDVTDWHRSIDTRAHASKPWGDDRVTRR